MNYPTTPELDAAIKRWEAEIASEIAWSTFLEAYNRVTVEYRDRNVRPKTLVIDSATIDRLAFTRWLYQHGRLTETPGSSGCARRGSGGASIRRKQARHA